jgi:hypothetical protein
VGRQAQAPAAIMRNRILTTAAIAAAVVVVWVALWPPAPRRVTGSSDPELRQRTLSGAFHVHSKQSDGAGTRPEIAAAAARAGLQFVVFTDHGDGTRPPEPPSYSSGVLCIDAVEISTAGGHYVALGIPKAPYRLGGEPSAVAEDVRRLGGFGIVAHPDSPKPALAWTDWTVDADGVEWLNADSEWRNESWPSLGQTVLGYLARPGPALAALLDRPVVTISRWDAMTARRQLPAFAGHDAHGGLGGTSEEGRRFNPLRVPSYEASFRSFATRAVLQRRPAGNASEDAALLLDALRAGRTYTTIDGIAAQGWLEFRAAREGREAVMGERLAGSGPASLTARAPVLDGSTIVLLRNGTVVSETRGGEVSAMTSAPGAYRVEVRVAGRPSRAPWILSNPIYVDLPPADPPRAVPSAVEVASLVNAQWRTEHDPSSSAALVAESGRTGMTFQLQQSSDSAFAALVAPLPHPSPAFDSVLVEITSASPARISVQFRSADGLARWGRSVYVSPESGPTLLRTEDFVPAERRGRPFDAAAAESVLLVVDLVNSPRGSSGRIVVRNLALARAR